MVHQFYKPIPELEPYIRDFLLLHFRFDKLFAAPPKIYPVLPEQGFTFYVRGSCISETPEISVQDKRPRSVIWGQTLHRQNLHVDHEKEYIMINVCFKPGALFKLFRIPMTDFLHKNIDAEMVLGKEMCDINEKLANAKNYEKLKAIINTFFVSKIRKMKDQSWSFFEKIPSQILVNPNQFNLLKMADDSCLCNSQFERKFKQTIGINPKFYARISRFEKAYIMKEQNQHLDWLSIAINVGYTDYQHLVIDFKQFSGVNPTVLFHEINQSPEKYLALI
jgi:AraC-like DNA-binding protein